MIFSGFFNEVHYVDCHIKENILFSLTERWAFAFYCSIVMLIYCIYSIGVVGKQYYCAEEPFCSNICGQLLYIVHLTPGNIL